MAHFPFYWYPSMGVGLKPDQQARVDEAIEKRKALATNSIVEKFMAGRKDVEEVFDVATQVEIQRRIRLRVPPP